MNGNDLVDFEERNSDALLEKFLELHYKEYCEFVEAEYLKSVPDDREDPRVDRDGDR